MLNLLKYFIKSIPIIGDLSVSLSRKIKIKKFNSTIYWEDRYLNQGNSGSGSYNHLAQFKAEVINNFVISNNITSIIEFGCGDGNQLTLSHYPNYIGFDVSNTSVNICRELFAGDKTKSFFLMDEYAGEKCQCTLSLDVIFHLVEDVVFERYMKTLFSAAESFVIIYSSNTNDQSLTLPSAIHVHHRKFSEWVDRNCEDWTLINFLPNKYPYNSDCNQTSFADFFIYARNIK